ncbi:MAG: hypothetical protein GX638_04295 [Crenarchaeota archaeon]|nr:hypothetical protein [Thermoproteota archaeon]
MTFVDFKNEYKKLNSDEEKTNFINDRLNQLLTEAKKIDSIGMGINGSYDSFIAPNVGIASNETQFFSKLVLDDMGVYKEFLDYIKNDIDGQLYGEPSTINAIQYFIWNYFGYNVGNVFQRMDVYSDGQDYLSIKDLRGKNIAACSERSAMVQNMLKFLGFDSELVFGKLNGTESHAYIIFKAGNGKTRILYDPMNPVVYTSSNSEKYCPGVCLMSEDEYMQLKSGAPFTFKYDLAKKLFIGNNSCTEDPREYSSDDIKYTLNTEDSLENNSDFSR